MLRGVVPFEVVDGAELSKHGKLVHKAMTTLERPSFENVVLYCVEVFGASKDAVTGYLLEAEKASALTGVTEILNKVRDKELLTKLMDEAGAMLHSGNLDVGLLGGLFESSGAAVGVESMADGLANGLPDPPVGLPLGTLPALTAHSGGIIDMWAIAGETGIGKSALAWFMALDIARHTPVIYNDYENGYPVVMHRIKEMFDGDLDKIRRATRNIFYRTGLRTLSHDLNRIPPPALIVVDSIQSVSSDPTNVKAGIDQWVHRFEQITKRGYKVLLISEVPRSAYDSDPHVGVFKETGTIEYKAGFGLQLKTGHSEGSLELHIVKNRHRPKKGLSCVLARKHGWGFREVSSQEELD